MCGLEILSPLSRTGYAARVSTLACTSIRDGAGSLREPTACGHICFRGLGLANTHYRVTESCLCRTATSVFMESHE